MLSLSDMYQNNAQELNTITCRAFGQTLADSYVIQSHSESGIMLFWQDDNNKRLTTDLRQAKLFKESKANLLVRRYGGFIHKYQDLATVAVLQVYDDSDSFLTRNVQVA